MSKKKENSEEVKPLGWEVPINIKERFKQFCEHIGAGLQGSCGGAIFIWPHLPAQIREWAILEANGKHPVDNGFWKRMEIHLIASLPILLESAPMPEAKKDVEGA